jgi:predicted GNAT superfamily acetyltransferase
MIELRDLSTVTECQAIVEAERAVWGMADVELVPASLLVVSVKCGGVLIGAFDDGSLAGFVYSFPGRRHGRLLQWSHMLGVLPPWRGTGLGYRLKVAQRERALAGGWDLIEWTYDPLQAVNASLNISKLGAIVEEYVEDAYGAMSSPLHRGAPTDRFVARWVLTHPRVEARLAQPAPPAAAAGATALNALVPEGRWLRCVEAAPLPEDGRPVAVEIPGNYTAMLAEAPDLALAWRLATRRIFTACLARGYRVTGFEARRDTGGGRYVLETGPI